VLMYFVLSSDGLASPSPDLTASLLQVVMLVMFAFLLGNREVNHPSQRTVAIALIFLAITAVTVKLSGLAFAGVIYVLVIFHVWRFCKTRRRDICLIVAATFLIASVWCARSYVLTGAPLYPSTVGYVTTEWSVPIELMKEEANWIYSWARQPREDWRNVLGSWDWLKPWYEKMYQRSVDMRHPIFVTILVGVICLLLGFGSKRQHKDQRQRMVGLWLILPLVAGVLFWFFTAPDPRFVHAQILLLPAVTSAILLTLLHGRMRKRLFLTTAALIFFTVNFNFIADLQHHPWHHKLISTTGWQPVRQVKLEARTTDSGLQVYIPITGDQCWDAPLPCTPYFKTELRLRDPDDLAAGFALTPSATK